MTKMQWQIAAVRQKLIVRIGLEKLALTFFGAGVLCLLMIVADKLVHLGLKPWHVLAPAGAALAAGLFLTFKSRPTTLMAAVALDDKLGLKEKFSTALAMEGNSDPFARAAVIDAQRAAGNVRLSGHFPLAFPRLGYWALGAMVLAYAATWLPSVDLFNRQQAIDQKQQEQTRIEQSKRIVQEAMAAIEKLPPVVQSSDQIQLAKKNLAEMFANPGTDPDKANRAVQETLTKAKDAMNNMIKENKAFSDVQRTQQMLKTLNDKPISGNGPVSQIQKSISEGNMQEALDEIEKLAGEFEKMDKNDQAKAADDMNKLAEAMNQIANDPQPMKKMEEKLKDAGLNKDQIEQIKENVQKAAEGDKDAQQQLNQMQQQIQQQMQQAGMNPMQQQQMQQAMQQAMQQGQQAANAQAQANQMAQNMQQMAQNMKNAANGQNGNMQQAMQQLQQQLQQMQQMQQGLNQAQQANQNLQQAMNQCNGQCNNPGQGQWKPGDANKQGKGQGGPGIGWGGKGEKSATPFGVEKQIDPSVADEKGQVLASVLIKDPNSIHGESTRQLQGIIDAGLANEGGDVEDTQTDRRRQEIEKRYFNSLKN
jgi:hypothetical protein